MADDQGLYRVVLAPAATTQFEAADLWWRTYRSAAPDLISLELTSALLHIARQPRIGRPAESPKLGSVRVFFLRRSGYNVYYRIREEIREAHVVYFRHARRRPLGRKRGEP